MSLATNQRTNNLSGFNGISFLIFPLFSEFFIGTENKETIWGASYEESAEQLTVNSDQLSRQQQTLRMNRTKNDTIRAEESMECSSVIATTSSTQYTSASIAISSTLHQDRFIHANISIADTEKENVLHVPLSNSRVDGKSMNVNEAINISTVGPAKAVPKIKLFAGLQRKKSAANTLHSTDMSLDVSSTTSNRKTTFAPQSMSVLEDTSHLPPLHVSLMQRVNETNVNVADMSVMQAQTRRSVICKSPSKKAPQNGNATKNQTINYGGETMDETQAVRENLQISRHPLNASSMHQSHVEVPSKPTAATNPYLRMFLGENSTGSVNEQKPIEIEVPTPKTQPSVNQNVTAYESMAIDTSSIALDRSHGAVVSKYPSPAKIAAVSETLASNHAISETNYNQFSIDKSYDFPLPTPVVQVEDKENIFAVPPLPALNDRRAFAAHNSPADEKVSLSETINTTVFNLHRDHIVNSTNRSIDSNPEASLQPSIELTNISLETSDAPIAHQALAVSINSPQPLIQHTIHCNQSIRNDSTLVSDQNNDLAGITNRMPAPSVITVPKKRRVTCFKAEPIDESIAFENVVERMNENTKIPMSPAVTSPINATVHDSSMNISTTPMAIAIPAIARRKTAVFENEPISAETTLIPLPSTSLDSYHSLSMEPIASRETSVAGTKPILTHSVPQISLSMPRLSYESNRALDEYCQLTFIDDEDMDLIDSTDGNDDDGSVVADQTMDASAIRPEHSMNVLPAQSRSNMSSSAFETRLGNSRMSLASPMSSVDEPNALKQSVTLRRSTFKGPSTSAASESTSKSIPNRTSHQLAAAIAARNCNESQNSTDVSYLKDITVDKQAKDIKLDFSGHDKFKGLATPNDVCNAFFRRCEIFKQRIHQMGEMAKSQNIPDPQSQNVEAPSLKFLFFNKLAMLE